MSESHVTELIPGYVFGALAAEDRKRVEQHLAGCPSCTESVALGQHCAALLAYVVTPYRAPLDLKESLLRAAGVLPAEAQEAPQTATVDAGDGSAPESASRTASTAVPTRFSWKRFAFFTVPWTVAVLGWLVAATLLIYSHGQADRLATSKLDYQAQIADLTAQRDEARVIQEFMFTPGVKASPLIYQAGTARHTIVTLFSAPGYIHAVLAARGLAPLPKGKVYCIWARSGLTTYVSLGTLITAGSRAEGVAVLVAPLPLGQYYSIGVSIELTPAPARPATPLIFLLKQHPLPTQ